MSTIANLHTVRQARQRTRASGITYCRSGFHQWQVVTEQRFDVREGKLLTIERCTRCGKTRNKAL
jgi:hypothetical protein